VRAPSLLLLLLAACDLQIVNTDTGTLEKLRVIHVGLDAAGVVLHVVDKAPNPRDVRVSIGFCDGCPLSQKPEDALVVSGVATRLHESLWEYHFDPQPFTDAGVNGVLIGATDGVTSDQAFATLQELRDHDNGAPFAIDVSPLPLRPNATAVLAMAPEDSVRWYVSANAFVDDRKTPSTTLEVLRANKGDRVYVYGVSRSGLGQFTYAVFDVQ
jgi:hypothetical protein